MTTPTNLPSDFEGTEKSTTPEAPISHKFQFTGDGGDMVPIVLKNLLFNILTLSLYRFWGRTNVRRYIWENTKFMGDPFEYTGKGGEMFIGFLIVLFLVFLPLFGLVTWAQMLIQSGDAPLGVAMMTAFYFFLLWLIPLGLYKAMKYRMSRTRWRGVRGAQGGSSVAYAFDAFSFSVLTILTLGILTPYMENRLWTRESNNRSFGSGKFAYSAGSGPLYGAFFQAIGLVIVGYVIMTAVFMGMGQMMAQTMTAQGSMDARKMADFISYQKWIMIGMIIMLYFFIGFAFCVYHYAKLKHFWNNSTFEGVPFSFSGTRGDMIKMYLGNLLLLIGTLGIAYPVTQMRFVRYMAESLTLEGDIDLAAITQSSEAEPSFGEGLAEGFDMGTI